MYTAVLSHFLSAHSPQTCNIILMVTSTSGSSAVLGEAAIMFITAQDLFPAFETLFPVCAHKALIFSLHLHSNSAAPQQDSHSLQVPYQHLHSDHAAGLNRLNFCHIFHFNFFFKWYGNIHMFILKERDIYLIQMARIQNDRWKNSQHKKPRQSNLKSHRLINPKHQ